MLRFAFAPVADMNIADLRIALLTYLSAQKSKEEFIVRIDDANKEKNIEGKDQEVLDLLTLFQIQYSQVIHQSQNFRFHSAMALQLLHEKKAFSCFCSDEWLEKKRQEAQSANKPYSYDDACRNLPAELVIDNTAPFSVRIIRPDREISFVILHRDKTPTDDFASAVDDMLSDVSLVINYENQIKNTPKQIHIRNQLGYEKKIEYAHLPPLQDAKKITVKELLEQGYLPEAISNYLILLGNETPREIFTLQEAQEWFTFETLSNSPARFDMDKLREINKEHMKIMNATELSRYVGFADAEIGELARIYLTEVGTTRELKEKIAPIFAPREIPEAFKSQIAPLKDAIMKAPYFESYTDFKDYLIKETGLAGEDFTTPLRILLTNKESGPDIEDIYKYLKNYIGEIIK